jgi:hypothetical protein
VIVVRPSDGRERGILRSATDDAASPGEWPAEDLRAFITVRTLLPLANHVQSVLASRDGDHEGGRKADQTFATQEGAGAGLPDGKAAPTVVGAAGRAYHDRLLLGLSGIMSCRIASRRMLPNGVRCLT